MTEWRFLPKLDYRLVLWRNTIQLFHQYISPGFVGPFKAAGLQYCVGPYLLTRQSREQTPDIVASGETGWMVLELTTQSGSKAAKLESYRSIDPQNLPQFGLSIHEGEPDTMSSRLSFVDDGPHCQILVRDKLKVEKEDYVTNQHLKEALVKAKGIDLTRLPEVPITLLPEMKSGEICRGLIDGVMQVFEPDSSGMSSAQLVEEGLERLYDKIGLRERHALMKKVEHAMETLIAKHLPEYLEYKDNIYRATEKWKEHHKTMGYIASKLKEWAGDVPRLEDYHSETSAENDVEEERENQPNTHEPND